MKKKLDKLAKVLWRWPPWVHTAVRVLSGGWQVVHVMPMDTYVWVKKYPPAWASVTIKVVNEDGEIITPDAIKDNHLPPLKFWHGEISESPDRKDNGGCHND